MSETTLQQGRLWDMFTVAPGGVKDIKVYRREEIWTITHKMFTLWFDWLIGTLQYCRSTCKNIIIIVELSKLIQKSDVMNNLLQAKTLLEKLITLLEQLNIENEIFIKKDENKIK